MHLSLVILLTFASNAIADYIIITTPTRTSWLPGQTVSFSNIYQVLSWSSYTESKWSKATAAAAAYASTITNDPKVKSAQSAWKEYLKTGKNIPIDVTNLYTTATYTTAPEWYMNMPTGVKEVLESMKHEEERIVSTALYGGVAKPTAMPKYVGAGAVAIAAAALL